MNVTTSLNSIFASSTSSAMSTHTPYYQPPPDRTTLHVATYIVVPILILSFTLIAGIWYLIHRRRMMLKEKRLAMEASTLGFANKEAARQKRRDKEREHGNKNDRAMRGAVEGLGLGLMAAGG